MSVVTKYSKLSAVIIAALFISVCIYGCNSKNTSSQKETVIELKAIELGTDEWGYQIDVNGKRYIYQDIIPAISGDKKFKTKEDALKVGQITVDKLRKGEALPTLSIKEIKSSGIEF